MTQERHISTSKWEESRIAKLVGLEEKATPSNSAIQEIQPTTIDKQATDPNSVRTKQPLSANPFAKAGLVGATTLVAVLVAGGFLSQIMGGGGKQQAKKNPTIQQQTQPEAPPRLQQLETEVETLKTKLALAKQAEAVKAAQEELRNTKPKSEVAEKPSPPKTPAPVKNISPPQVITRVIREPQPVPQPQTQPAPPPPPPAPPEKPDPMQEWQRLAKLGSYGMVTQDISKQDTIASAPAKKVEPPLNKPKSELRPKPRIASQRRPRNTKSTVIGSSAEAVIATAVFGETTKSRSRQKNNQNDNVFVVRLEEPLRARDGEVVVPKGSEIRTKVSSISDNGLVELNVTKVLLRGKNGFIKRDVTPNALAIRAPKGKPLIAKNYSNKGSSTAQRDAISFFLGGVGRAAQLFNRNESRVTTTTTGSVVTSSNDDPNILAGIFEGGIRSVVPQITRRNQQAISRMSPKGEVWFIKAGKKVEVYVNQEVRF